MPRFVDNWVVDKCMFDYVSGGTCACCGFSHLLAPGGFEDMVTTMSDLETDAARHEINAAKASPWPPDMRDQIWSDRLLLRFRMKKGMKRYRSFLEGIVQWENVSRSRTCMEINQNDKVNIEDAVPVLQHFCMHELTPKELREVFQLPRSELTETLKSEYKICSAYAVVFCTVVEQVANFKLTGYPVDARSGSGENNYEERFEKELSFVKVGPGFCLKIVKGTGDNLEVDEAVLLVFLRRMVSLAGPTLLARAAKCSYNEDGDNKHENESDEDADGASEKNESNVTSFRSDRRVIRLLIARYWADRLIDTYKAFCARKNKQQTTGDTEAEQ